MPGMSHISHLYASYPSSQINWRNTPEMRKAVAKSIELRFSAGADPGGWPLAWRICQYARLLDREHTGQAVEKMLGRATASFLNGRRVFQIDGNRGAAAGMAEALIQSHTGLIHLLPALPPAWENGCVKGLRARGAVEADIAWENGKLTEAEIRPERTGVLEIRAEGLREVLESGRKVAAEETACGLKFAAEAGKTYSLR